MLQHNPLHLNALYQQSGRQKRGYAIPFVIGLGLILSMVLMFGPGGFITSALEGYQNAAIKELQEENRLLVKEVERLKSAPTVPDAPYSQSYRDLVERIFAIEQHQNALIEAIKGPQNSKLKRSSLDDINFMSFTDQTKQALLNERLDDIEKEHMSLAKSLTERSENNARVLSLMLNSVSERLVPQRLFGKGPTGNKSNMGGPYMPSGLSHFGAETTNKFNPHYVGVVSNAIETMHYHARLYTTLINLPLSRPLMGEAQYVSGFGNRSDPFTRQPAFHAGIDLKQNFGSAVISTGNGIVTHAGPADGYGNMVEVAHADGVSTRYGHLDKISVKLGDTIVTGAKLGTLGSTGRSTGPHLHYETRINDQAVNPIPFMQMGERLKGLNLINTAAR